MHPNKVQRDKLNKLSDLPNVGKAVAEDLALLGHAAAGFGGTGRL